MNIVKRFWPILVLLGIEVILFITNYKPGTYLIGWDSLMPEFNIKLNISRGLFDVWQNYRGLGYPDGMSQVASIVHTLYIGLLDLVLPQSVVRYVFTFLTHLAGGIAFFYLAKKLVKNTAVSLFWSAVLHV